ncbi:MAG: Ldh family oxidoreductase [Chloroflexi bacterium]|nr:Ldh family oxidoreductase [Chloroflexota bacterium]MQC16733.1 Ldh family oxidoreductase [Chloroflexota bacterium]
MSVTVPAGELTEFIASIFEGVGCPRDEAQQVGEHLVGANLRGHDSHGVIRTLGYVQQVRNGTLIPGAPTTVERESAATALIDGGWNLGQPVAIRAMDIAVAKAREAGVAFVSVHNVGHIGRVGAYGEQAIAHGMIAMGGVNSPGGRLTAAFGGTQRRTGTSPIMIAMPGGNPQEPFVLDMATSVVAEGKLKVAVNAGKPVPDGWIVDGDGSPTTDARDFYGTGASEIQGALLPVGGPIGGYKGFGLNLAMETLSGILSRAGSSVAGTRGSNGVWFMALDLSRFLPVEEFTSAFDELIEFVKEPPYAPGHDEILVAGEPERRRMTERLAGGINLDDETWRQILAAAEDAQVAAPPGR